MYQLFFYKEDDQTYQLNFKSANIDSEDKKKTLNYIFSQYKIVQEYLQNKFPYSNYIKVGKIEKITQNNDSLNIQYYYEGFEGEKLDINYIEHNVQIDEGFKQIFALDQLEKQEQEVKNLDFPSLKNVLFSLIEIFYWSANFGLFLDPIQDCLYYYKEKEQFVLLPSFILMNNYLFQSQGSNLYEKFQEFRCKCYQKATYNFLYQFYQIIKKYGKETDEDKQFFEEYFNEDPKINHWKQLIQMENKNKGSDDQLTKGSDYLFNDERLKYKLPRTIFKQTMLLYQLQNNQVLSESFKSCQIESQKIANQEGSLNLLEQFNNLINFFQSIPKEFNSESYEIFGQFMTTMYNYLKSKNVSENKIDMAPYTKVVFNSHKIEISTQDQNYQIKWTSTINKPNKSYREDSNNQQKTQDDLTIQYTFLKDNKSIIIKTYISEVQFSIDNADDIIYLINMLIREPTAINIYVDEQRKLTLQTSILMVNPMEIFRISIKIFDTLQIYYHMILEFYRQNIQLGRSIKDKKYQLFANEIQHYVQDYEIDFDEQMKKIDAITKSQQQQQQQQQQ